MKQSHAILECGDSWPLPGCQGPLTGLVMEVDMPIPISLHDSLETPCTLKDRGKKTSPQIIFYLTPNQKPPPIQ